MNRKAYNKEMVRFTYLCLLASLCIVTPLCAQGAETSGQTGEITSSPVCGKLINRSSVKIVGSLASYPQTLPDGTKGRHVTNFTLEPGDKQDICATGPFYAGRRLELVIRSLFPLFSCYTHIDGTIFLDVEARPDGGKKYSATCS